MSNYYKLNGLLWFPEIFVSETAKQITLIARNYPETLMLGSKFHLIIAIDSLFSDKFEI